MLSTTTTRAALIAQIGRMLERMNNPPRPPAEDIATGDYRGQAAWLRGFIKANARGLTSEFSLLCEELTREKLEVQNERDPQS